MIPRLVPEIEGGILSVTEEKEQKKDWSWSILVVGCAIGDPLETYTGFELFFFKFNLCLDRWLSRFSPGHHTEDQGVTTRCSLAAGLRGNGERMRK